MNPMRRKDRLVTDPAALEGILQACKVCRIAMTAEARPYIVPLNFGYERQGDTLILYFHCAREGRKLDLLRKNPEVSFEMDCGHGLVGAGAAACDYSYTYASIIGEGRVDFLEDGEEKARALGCIMAHQAGPRSFTFDPAAVARTCVFRLTVECYSGKRH